MKLASVLGNWWCTCIICSNGLL